MVTNDEFKGCGMQLRAERERLGLISRIAEPLNGPTSLHGIWQPSNWAKKFQRPTYW